MKKFTVSYYDTHTTMSGNITIATTYKRIIRNECRRFVRWSKEFNGDMLWQEIKNNGDTLLHLDPRQIAILEKEVK